MARPKKNTEGKSAQVRLENAFWEALEEAPYSAMTIMGISKRASVNHNTFYRYYNNLDDMAQKAFNGLVLYGLPEILISASAPETILKNTIITRVNPEDIQKVLLFAQSGSSYLTSILHDTIAGIWLKAAGVDKENLTAVQKFDLDIIFGGLVAALGNTGSVLDPVLVADTMDRPLNKAMIATLASLAEEAKSAHKT